MRTIFKLSLNTYSKKRKPMTRKESREFKRFGWERRWSKVITRKTILGKTCITFSFLNDLKKFKMFWKDGKGEQKTQKLFDEICSNEITVV